MNMLLSVSSAEYSKKKKSERYTPGWVWTRDRPTQNEKMRKNRNSTYLSLREALFSTGLAQCFGVVEGAEWTSKVRAECWGLLHVLGLKYSSHLSKGSSKSLPCGDLITCLTKSVSIYIHTCIYTDTYILTV